VKQIRNRLTYANVMSSIAIFLVLGGAAFAAAQLPKNSVGKKQLKNNAVVTAKIKKNAVTAAKIKAGAVLGSKIAAAGVTSDKLANGSVTNDKLANGSVTGAKIANGAVTGASVAPGSLSSAALSDVRMIPLTKVGASSGSEFDTARDAASSHVLYTRGPLTIYAKCFTAEDQNRTYAIAYISTSQGGSVFVGGSDGLEGDPFLNPGTEEDEREIYDESASENSASGWRSIFQAAAPDGTAISGQIATYAKNGTPTEGDGIYGGGNACLFSGFVNG
jgi:hypothetical protein